QDAQPAAAARTPTTPITVNDPKSVKGTDDDLDAELDDILADAGADGDQCAASSSRCTARTKPRPRAGRSTASCSTSTASSTTAPERSTGPSTASAGCTSARSASTT